MVIICHRFVERWFDYCIFSGLFIALMRLHAIVSSKDDPITAHSVAFSYWTVCNRKEFWFYYIQIQFHNCTKTIGHFVALIILHDIVSSKMKAVSLFNYCIFRGLSSWNLFQLHLLINLVQWQYAIIWFWYIIAST